MTVDKKGELHLTALDTVVPEAAKQLQRRLERRIPLISLADFLNEVDLWTGFLRHFTDLVSDEVPEGKRRQITSADADCCRHGPRDEPRPRQAGALDAVQLPTTRLGCAVDSRDLIVLAVLGAWWRWEYTHSMAAVPRPP